MSTANRKKTERIPAGFKTVPQWAAKEGLSVSHTQKLVRDLVLHNPPLVERRVFLCRDALSGNLRHIPHYKKIKQASGG